MDLDGSAFVDYAVLMEFGRGRYDGLVLVDVYRFEQAKGRVMMIIKYHGP